MSNPEGLITRFPVRAFLYKASCGLQQLLDLGRLHPVRERKIQALRETMEYIHAHMQDAIGFDSQREILGYALKMVKLPGHYLEFGVYKGGTIRFIAKHVPVSQTIHGFDSFEGLPEPWAGFNNHLQGTLTTHGNMPKLPGNVVLHKGLFKDTLPVWKQKHTGPVAFIHVDCDLYAPTKDVLENLADRVEPGTILLFDEYFNCPGWQQHEHKAWKEFVGQQGLRYEYLGFAREQVVVRVMA